MLAVSCVESICQEKTIEILLKHGPNVNMTNDHKWSAIMLCIYWYSKKSTPKIIKLLIKFGADVNMQNDYGWSALSLAVNILPGEISKYVVKQLVKYKADINQKNIHNENAIIIAFEKYKPEIVDILLPNRKFFLHKTIIYKSQLNKTKFWKIKQYDFKISFVMAKNFNDVLLYN